MMKSFRYIIMMMSSLALYLIGCTDSDSLKNSFPYDEGDVTAMIKIYQGMNIDCLPDECHWDLSKPGTWPDWIVRWEDDSVENKKHVVYLNMDVIGPSRLKGNPIEARVNTYEPDEAMVSPMVGRLKHLRFLRIKDYYTCVMPLQGLYECPLETLVFDYSGRKNKGELLGTIDWVVWLSNLKYLNVTHTSLSGSLPPLTKFRNLSFLGLANNRFSGIIPESYINMRVEQPEPKDGYGINLEGNGLFLYPWGSLRNASNLAYFPYATTISGEVPYKVHTDRIWTVNDMDRRVMSINPQLRKAPQPE